MLALARVVVLVAGVLAGEGAELVEDPVVPAAERPEHELLGAARGADVEQLPGEQRGVQ